MTQIENKALETSLSELQGYMKNWAIIEPETTLILGNVRRMLNEAHAAGALEALEDVAMAVSTNAGQEIIERGNAKDDNYFGYMTCIQHTEVILKKRIEAVLKGDY